MPTLSLKSYQQAALDTLAAFARAAQNKGPALAFGELVGRPYNPDPFGEVPCVCLRIPTGGGKTLMAAHAVRVLAAEWRATDAPVAVWLVPSDTIRSQTLKALQTTGHLVNDPYEIEKRQVGELWARKSRGRCLFGQVTKERNGVGTAGQLDALLV